MYKILIVDDESSICEGLKKLIDWKKYKVEYIESAESYSEAIKIGVEFKPDIVLLDVCLGKLTGYNLIDKFNSMGLNFIYIMISGYDEFEFVREAIRPEVRDYLLKPIQQEKLENILKKILVEDFGEDISLNTEEEYNSILNKKYKELSGVINIILSYVEENYSKDISLKTIADDIKMNSVYLGKLFFKETGMRFTDYLKSYRMIKAKELIQKTPYKIAYIAKTIGYSNLNYFYSHFKEYYGLAPTDLRENNLSNDD
ncbi:MAG TPA: response regulator [Clostridiales bacterium]|nr:response regulator [Clostridiales bacterium]